MLLSATSTDMLSYCERVNVFGERCRRVVFSETGLPALPILEKPVLPYTQRLVGSCQSTPRGRKHHQHECKDKAYGLYCDKGFESTR